MYRRFVRLPVSQLCFIVQGFEIDYDDKPIQ